jgi:hypothetical protein
VEQVERPSLDLWESDEEPRTWISQNILEALAQDHAEDELIATSVREIAARFAEENPIDLLLQLAQWVCDDLNRLAEKIRKMRAKSRSDAKELETQLGFRRKKAERFLQRLFRFDHATILTIPTIKQMIDSQTLVKIDLKQARERLQERVVGAKMIEIVTAPENKHRYAVGTDASVGDIYLPHRAGSFIPPIPANLFIAGGAMRANSTTDQYWDFDLDPKDLSQYQENDAAQEGLFISPRLREQITDYRHLMSAAMELRQYREELRIVTHSARWHPYGQSAAIKDKPKPTLIFRDGRIFPLVHRLDDYDGASAPDDILYGKVVRNEIDTFHTVFHNTAGLSDGGVTYAGAVKAPEFSWLSMIVFWYIYTYTHTSKFADAFYNPHLNDQAVAHLLFWGVYTHHKMTPDTHPRALFTSFRVLRHFSDIAFPSHPLIFNDGNYVDEQSSESWESYIDEHIQDAGKRYAQHKRGIDSLGSVSEYLPFLDLCRRTGIAMFYAAPVRTYQAVVTSQSHFLMPRWEVCVDLANSPHKQAHKAMLSVFSWIADTDGLEPDGYHAGSGFDKDQSSSIPLLVPDVIVRVHETVTKMRDTHKEDLYDLIQKYISAAMERYSKSER